jgi:hypothetical protein
MVESTDRPGEPIHRGVADVFPTDCVLCDFSGETHEEYEQHINEVHD